MKDSNINDICYAIKQVHYKVNYNEQRGNVSYCVKNTFFLMQCTNFVSNGQSRQLISLSKSPNLYLYKNQLHWRESKVYMGHGTKENHDCVFRSVFAAPSLASFRSF